MLTFLKYALWLATTLLAVAGEWFFEFTESDTDGRKRLTKWGKVALPIAGIAIVLALIVTALEDRHEAESARAAKEQAEKDQQELTAKLNEVREHAQSLETTIAQSQQSLTHVILAIGNPGALDRLMESPHGREHLRQLLCDPAVARLVEERADVARVVGSIEERMGGRSAVLRRLNRLNPSRHWTDGDIALVGTFSLRWFGRDGSFPEKPEVCRRSDSRHRS